MVSEVYQGAGKSAGQGGEEKGWEDEGAAHGQHVADPC